MKNIQEILSQIARIPDCFVYPKQGRPKISINHTLPDDLHEFYLQCGGISLFRSSAYSMDIIPPSKFLLANPIIFNNVSEKDLQASKGDISWSWYIVGEGENKQFITIDLSSERLGRCYDSFWDCHAMPGYSPIISKSFTELLNRLVANQGKHWFWLLADFNSYGDAFG